MNHIYRCFKKQKVVNGCKSVLELEMPAGPPESTEISVKIKTDGDLLWTRFGGNCFC